MTAIAYQIVKKALLKKKAELKASPASAKKFLVDSGLGDVLKDAPVRKGGKAVVVKKASKKTASA